MKKIKHPHDLLFKNCFSDLNLAKEFFECYLEKKFRSLINLQQLEVIEKTFIHPNLRKQEGDVLFAAPFINKPGKLYLLLEHLSNLFYRLPLRMLEQQIFIMKQHKKVKYLPIVRSLAYFTGKKAHLQKRHIHQLIESKLLSLQNNILSEPIDLIAANDISNEEIRSRKFTALMELAFKLPHCHNIVGNMPILIELIQRAEKLGQHELIKTVIHHLLNTIEMNRDIFIETV